MSLSQLISKLNSESKTLTVLISKDGKKSENEVKPILTLAEVNTNDLYDFIGDYLTNESLKEHKISGRLKTNDNPMIEVTKRVSEVNGKKIPANYFKADLEVKLAYFQTGVSINSRVEFNLKKVDDGYKWFVTETTSSDITKLTPNTIEGYTDIIVRVNRYLNKIEPVIEPII